MFVSSVMTLLINISLKTVLCVITCYVHKYKLLTSEIYFTMFKLIVRSMLCVCDNKSDNN